MKDKNFDDIAIALKNRGLPFVFIEVNPNGVEYQVYAPDTDEFEVWDCEELKKGTVKVLEIINDEICKLKNHQREGDYV